jgi:raffinose/stachyose/melibiose transport system substrate-binding protein
MKKATKKASLLLIAAAIMLLSACSSGTKESTSSAAPDATATTATTDKAAETPVKNAEPVTLKLFTTTGGTWGENKGLLNVIDAFQKKYPTIKVQVDAVPKMEEVLPVRIATADFPDMTYYHTGDPWYKSLKADENLVDLGDLNLNAQLVPGVEDWTKLNGKVYSLLFGGMDVAGILYNKDVFTKLGLQIPTNKAEFYAISDKIKAAGIIPYVIGAKDAWSTQIFAFDAIGAYATTNPNWIKDINANKTTFDKTPAFVQMLADFQELKTKGYMNKDALSTTVDAALEMMATGKAAMFEMATWSGAGLVEKFPNAKVGLFPNPLPSDKPVVSTFATGGLMIFKKSKHVDEAKQFLQFAASEEGLRLFYDQNPQIPVYKNVVNQLSPISQDGNEYVKQGQVSLNFRDSLIVNFPLENSLQDVIAGKKPEDVAKKIQTELETNAKSQNVAGF